MVRFQFNSSVSTSGCAVEFHSLPEIRSCQASPFCFPFNSLRTWVAQIRRLLPLMGMEAADFVGLSCCHRAWKNTKKSKPSGDGFSTSWIMEFARPMTAVWWATRQEDWFSARGSPSSRPPAPTQLARRQQFELLGAEAGFLTCALKDHRGTERKVKKIWGLH